MSWEQKLKQNALKCQLKWFVKLAILSVQMGISLNTCDNTVMFEIPSVHIISSAWTRIIIIWTQVKEKKKNHT